MDLTIIQVAYLFIPAYIANITPILVRKIPWNTPMDFGITWKGQRLLGNHKTWRGFVLGVLTGILTAFVLSNIYWPVAIDWLAWSLLISFGALLGDAIESFFKRQLRVAPGKPWIPFDQIDSWIGALLLGSVVYFPGWKNAVLLVVLTMLGHFLMNRIGYMLKLKETPW